MGKTVLYFKIFIIVLIEKLWYIMFVQSERTKGDNKQMRKTRRELEITLNSILEAKNTDKDFLNGFIGQLEGKFSRGKSVRVFDKSIQLTILTIEELCLITQALFKLTNMEEINPDGWFIKSEITSASLIAIGDTSEEEVMIELENFIRKGKRDEWLGYLSYREVYELYEKGYLTYNQETQRKATVIERDGGKYILPTIFKKSVFSIAKNMIDGKFHTNTITLNITKNLKESVIYDDDTRTLAIPIEKKTEIAIVDGAHRILGIVKAVSTKPDLDGYIAVNVKNLSVEEAQEFIYQEALTNRQNLKDLKKSDKRDDYMEMAKLIARMRDKQTNILFNKIGFIEMDEKMNDCFVTGERFSMALKDNFKDLCEDGSVEPINVASYVVDFFNHIAELYPYEFQGDFEVLKKRTISTCSNFYVGMMVLARRFFGHDDWKEELEEILEDMTWDIRDKTWKQYGVSVDTLSIKTKKKIYEYFSAL